MADAAMPQIDFAEQKTGEWRVIAGKLQQFFDENFRCGDDGAAD
jgi:hypothetical protein